MSGTSLDGIDVALVGFDGEAERPSAWEVRAFHGEAYDAASRARLRAAIEAGSAATLCDLNVELGERIAAAVRRALRAAGLAADDVRAIGSHGQTVWHRPPEGEAPGATLQLGCPAVIAERTSIPVVSDFRARDVAAGGEGAPLTAYVDALLLRGHEARAIQNIGGMANVTALPALGDDRPPVAFDSGPGVALLDAAVERLSGGSRRFDEDGRLALAGTVDEDALAAWLADPYFERPPPKSTGRERFTGQRLERWLDDHPDLSIEDAAATLTELTARTIADAYRWIEDAPAACYLCGGGARNPALTGRLSARLAPVPVRDLSVLGLDPDAREAVGFALLARQHALGIPANAPWATGARGPRVLGSWTPA